MCYLGLTASKLHKFQGQWSIDIILKFTAIEFTEFTTPRENYYPVFDIALKYEVGRSDAISKKPTWITKTKSTVDKGDSLITNSDPQYIVHNALSQPLQRNINRRENKL